jgi:hypothetical protein
MRTNKRSRFVVSSFVAVADQYRIRRFTGEHKEVTTDTMKTIIKEPFNDHEKNHLDLVIEPCISLLQ